MSRLEVITGPMFSGKSEEVIRRLRRAAFANQKLLLTKPDTDNRKTRSVFSLAGRDRKLKNYEQLRMFSFGSVAELISAIDTHEQDILAIDEAQFLSFDFLDAIVELLDKNKQKSLVLVAAGLNLDADARPFGIMPELLARADDICLLNAVCVKCGQPAIFTQKIAGTHKQIEVGDTIYEARCRACFVRASQIPLS